MFWFTITLGPCANIDLFIVNGQGQVLLTWRDDKFYGMGWHIPGGCIRIQEPLDGRIQKTALSEIGCKVEYDSNPIVIRESFVKEERPWLKNQLERSHNISLLYKCTLPEDYEIGSGNLQITDAGYSLYKANKRMLYKLYPILNYSVLDTTIFITIGSVLEVNKIRQSL